MEIGESALGNSFTRKFEELEEQGVRELTYNLKLLLVFKDENLLKRK